jgi:hypothetical protein
MADQEQALVRAPGEVQTNQMGEITHRAAVDVATATQVAHAQAAVQARYVMAIQRPRSEDNFRAKLMTLVKDPEFAALCEYARPVGKEKNAQGRWVEKVAKGPTIHLLRTALRLFGNNSSEPAVITETPDLRIGAVTISDYETNFHVVRTFTIEKRIEKRGYQNRQTGTVDPPPGREILGTRITTEGEEVYIVRMNLDELRKEELRQTALAKRAAAEEFLPRHIIRAALLQAVKTTHDADAKDPQGAKNKLIDAFAELRVMAVDLEQYLGHTLERLTSDELSELRGVWTRISNEEATWEECIRERNPVGSAEDADKVRNAKLAALTGSQTVSQAEATARMGNSGGEMPSGEAKVPTSTSQGSVGTISTVDAPAPDKRYITIDQAQEFAQVIHANNLDDEQIAKLVKAGGAERYDQMRPDLYEVVLKMARATKGKGNKK